MIKAFGKRQTIAGLFVAVSLAALPVTAAMNPKVGGAPMYATKNIVENAVNSKVHTTLVAAVKAAGLVETLESPGPFTVFAPTNSAFAKLPKGTVETLLKPENLDKLKAILTYHVVSGTLTAADLMNQIKDGGGKAELKTVEGETLTVMKAGKGLTVTDAKGDVGPHYDPERHAVERRDPRHRHGNAACRLIIAFGAGPPSPPRTSRHGSVRSAYPCLADDFHGLLRSYGWCRSSCRCGRRSSWGRRPGHDGGQFPYDPCCRHPRREHARGVAARSRRHSGSGPRIVDPGLGSVQRGPGAGQFSGVATFACGCTCRRLMPYRGLARIVRVRGASLRCNASQGARNEAGRRMNGGECCLSMRRYKAAAEGALASSQASISVAQIFEADSAALAAMAGMSAGWSKAVVTSLICSAVSQRGTGRRSIGLVPSDECQALRRDPWDPGSSKLGRRGSSGDLQPHLGESGGFQCREGFGDRLDGRNRSKPRSGRFTTWQGDSGGGNARGLRHRRRHRNGARSHGT